MGLKKIIYPLDFSGTRKENRVTEKHTIGDEEYRAFSLRNGPFYADDVVIKEEGSNIPLIPDDDYTCVMHFDDLSKLTPGKDIEGVIVVHNTKVSKNIVVEANIVGGPFAHSAQAIQDAIDELEIDNRNIYWHKVIDKPELFTPPPHIHDIGDVYGFEFIISMLAQIGDTLMVGDNVQMVAIKKRLNELEADFRERHRIHLEDYKNPHRVTAHQTNAYFKEEIDKFLEGVQQQFSDLEPRFKDIQTAFNEVDERINVLSNVFNNNARQLSANEKRLNRFQKLLADLNRNIDRINDRLNAIDVEIKGLKERDEELSYQISLNDSAILAESQRNDQQDKEIDNNANNIKAEKGRNDAQDRTLDDHDRRIRQNTDNLSKHGDRLRVLDQEQEVQDQKIGRLRRDLDGLLQQPPGLTWGTVQITGYVNNHDGKLNWTCPGTSVMVGLYSWHSNHTEDRRWRIRYRSLK